jgi:polyphosphate glucokinase
MDVLVIDVGGSHVKLCVNGSAPRRFESGSDLTPHRLVEYVRNATEDWSYDVLSIGFPGKVGPDGPAAEPGNLGEAWVGFDFEAQFGKPVRIVNDAVLQALGAYDGGRMLFLGLGTGLGSALATEHVIVPLELGMLPFRDSQTLADRVGKKGLEENGLAQWTADVQDMIRSLRAAFDADYVVLGGGNAERIENLPEGARRGGNDDAFTGGFLLWQEVVEPHDRQPQPVWRVVR